jgi:hypothetical protein
LADRNPAVAQLIRALRQEVGEEFGLASRVITSLLGPVLQWSARREERRLAAGHTYEPSPIIERRNWTGGAATPGRSRPFGRLTISPDGITS